MSKYYCYYFCFTKEDIKAERKKLNNLPKVA